MQTVRESRVGSVKERAGERGIVIGAGLCPGLDGRMRPSPHEQLGLPPS